MLYIIQPSCCGYAIARTSRLLQLEVVLVMLLPILSALSLLAALVYC
jgi:hypothetical protein